MEMDNEKNFLSFFKALIRYIASGFIFILALEYLRNDMSIWSFTKDNINWTLLVVAVICGILIYAIHAAFLDDVFYRFSLWWLIKVRKRTQLYLPKKFKKMSISEAMFHLTTHRYLREGKPGDEMKGLQNRLDQLLALLVFLYTSSYSLILLPIFFSVKNIFHSTATLFTLGNEIYWLELLGIFLLISAISLDLKITKRELFILLMSESKDGNTENKTVDTNKTTVSKQ